MFRVIDLKSVRSMDVSKEVVDFMQSCGGNHVSLYAGWKKTPKMGKDPGLLEQQLAYVLREETLELIKRILGRLRRANADSENKMLKALLKSTDESAGEEVQPLGCLI